MIDYENNVCFVHIPKNAGQSVERWFLELRGLDFDNEDHHRQLEMFRNDFSSGLPRANEHLMFSEYRDHVFGGKTPPDMRFFAIVRDPIDRLASELAYRFHGRVPPKPLLAMRSVPINHIFNNFRCHLQTQSSFLDGAEPEQISILRLETLAADFSELVQQYGLPDTPLPHINSSRGKKRQRQELPESVVAWAIETYAEDFERFGYDIPSTSVQMAA